MMYQCDDSDIKGGVQSVSLEDARELIAQQRERDKSKSGGGSSKSGEPRQIGNGTPAGRKLNRNIKRTFGG